LGAPTLITLGLITLGSASTARAQDTAPVASPTSPGDERALAREAGRLAATLAARRTQPPALFWRLRIEVSSLGSLVDRSRTLDVTRSLSPKLRALRVRFRAPEGLAGQAILLRAEGGERRAWRYDPDRLQVEPIKWPQGTQGLGGTGLVWADLWGPEPKRWRYRLDGEEELTVGEEPIRVLRVQAKDPTGTARLLHLERARRLPLCVEEPWGTKGRRQVWRSRWLERGGYYLSRRWLITTPTETSRVELREQSLEAPAAHLDPSRFQRG
jgi:hypothetical protein